MKILAFDIATKTGWAVGDVSSLAPCEHGTHSIAVAGDPYGKKYLRFHNWILRTLKNHRPDMIVYEKVRNHKGIEAGHVYGGLQAQILAASHAFSINAQGVGVGEVKKHFTGKGNATKEMMIEEAIRRGYRPRDDNAADAIAVFELARELYKTNQLIRGWS